MERVPDTPAAVPPAEGHALAATRRQQILDAAASVFVRRGFHAARMAEIATRFGMSAGHIYNHFDSKEAIVDAIVERGIEKARKDIAEIRTEPDPRHALRERVLQRMLARFDETDEVALELEILAEGSRNPRVAAQMQRVDKALRADLVTLFDDADTRALPDSDAAARLEVLMAFFEGMAARGIRHPTLDRAAVARVLEPLLAHLLPQ